MNTWQLDTNVLLRFLTQDDPAKAKEVDILFSKAEQGKFRLEICEPVFVETAVSLRNYFKFPRDQVTELLKTLLSRAWLQIENHEVISQALHFYQSSALDLVDCLIFIRAKINKQRIFTFDAKLNELVESLPPEEK